MYYKIKLYTGWCPCKGISEPLVKYEVVDPMEHQVFADAPHPDTAILSYQPVRLQINLHISAKKEYFFLLIRNSYALIVLIKLTSYPNFFKNRRINGGSSPKKLVSFLTRFGLVRFGGSGSLFPDVLR